MKASDRTAQPPCARGPKLFMRGAAVLEGASELFISGDPPKTVGAPLQLPVYRHFRLGVGILLGAGEAAQAFCSRWGVGRDLLLESGVGPSCFFDVLRAFGRKLMKSIDRPSRRL